MTVKQTWMLAAGIAFILVTAACTNDGSDPSLTGPPTSRGTTTTAAPATTTTTSVASEAPAVQLPVALVWTYHQPFLPGDNVASVSPRVRLETTRAYAVAVKELADNPEARVTMQLTPSLLSQLQHLANGVKDAWWELSEVPASALTEDQKAEIVSSFFDVDPVAFELWPRYAELRDLIEGAGAPAAAIEVLGDQDFRDLQVLFNLAWTHPRLRATAPLADLAAQGGGFTEADKSILLAEHHRMVSEVIPSLIRLRDAGQIELAAGSYSQAVLPLLADPSVALISDPAAIVPEADPPGIGAQVSAGLGVINSVAGGATAGFVPAGGAISSEVLAELAQVGVRWVATEEAVLAASLGLDPLLRSGNGVPAEPAELYAARPGPGGVGLFVGDAALADWIERASVGVDPEEAAADFVARLEEIRSALEAAGELDGAALPIVTVVIDGDAVGSQMPDGGAGLREALYRALTTSELIEMVTPSGYLQRQGLSAEMPELQPAGGDRPSLVKWIGDAQEEVAWRYLAQAWRDLGAYDRAGDPAAPDPVLHALLAAEAGDWFAAIGDDTQPALRSKADIVFRSWLSAAYEAAGQAPPPHLDIPTVPDTPAEPDRFPEGLIAPIIDFAAAPAEWSNAGRFADSGEVIKQVFYGFDDENFYVRVDFIEELLGNDDVGFQMYLGAEGLERARSTSLRGTPLGFAAGAVVDWAGANPVAACLYRDLRDAGTEAGPVDCRELSVGFDGDDVELAIPLRMLRARSGDQVWFRVVSNDVFRDTESFPLAGPALTRVPILSDAERVLAVADAAGDDYGGGTLTYPAGLADGTLDITSISVAVDSDTVLLDLRLREPFEPDGDDPRGLGGQVFDLYIDTDPQAPAQPSRMLPGRNAALASGWEHAVVVDGWRPALYHRSSDGAIREQAATVRVDAVGADGRILVRVPRILLSEGDPAEWGFAVVALVRDPTVMASPDIVADFRSDAGPWWGGGAANDITYPNVLDVVWPARGEQEVWLSEYRPLPSGDPAKLGPDWFATIPVLTAADLEPES